MSEEKQYITDRLRRYSRACLAERLDPDFAAAVYEAADGIESRDEIIKDLSAVQQRIMAALHLREDEK